MKKKQPINMRPIQLVLLLTTILLIVLMITSCAEYELDIPEACAVSQETNGVIITCPDGTTSFVPNGAQGEKGEAGEDLTPEQESKMDLAGYFLLPYGGIADIVKDGTGLYDVGVLTLKTLNPNDTICSLSLPRSNTPAVDGKISYSAGVNLVANNCRSDGNAKLETKSGTSYTYSLVISLNNDDLLSIRLVILQTKSGTTTLVIDRTITEE